MDTDVIDLVHAAVKGDESAWASIVERYLPLVRSVVRSYGLTGANAEDVGQLLWLRLVEHLAEIRDPRALPGWIATTTRNECWKLIKRNQRMVPVGATIDLTPPPESVAELDEELLRTERHEALLAALAQLPDHQRRLLELLAADPPLSYAEISDRLGIPIGSIGPTRARALRRLRQYLEEAAMIDPTSTEATP